MSENKNKTSILGWISLGLALLGFIFSVIPGISFVAWPVILSAFIISIIALVKKGSAKTVPIISLVLSIVSGIVAVIVSIVTALAVVAGAASQAQDDMTASQDEIQAGIGQVVTTSDGLELTVSAVTCGQPTYEGAFTTDTAVGQYCVIDYSIKNASSEPVFIFSNDFGGLVGENDLEAESFVGSLGPDGGWSIELNPGLTVTGVSVLDIPSDAALDAVTFGGMGRDEIAIANK